MVVVTFAKMVNKSHHDCYHNPRTTRNVKAGHPEAGRCGPKWVSRLESREGKRLS